MMRLVTAIAFILLCASRVFAGEADVIAAEAHKTGEDTWRFDVTVRHEDQGWGHYADRFEVLGPKGVILGSRVLHHPHVYEQPFTRSLSGVRISPEIDLVKVRARDSVHHYGGATVEVRLGED